MQICPKCGLPLQACVCEEIAKTEQKIKIQTEKKRFGKVITIISGFQDVDLKTLSKELKHKLSCGGTVRDKSIELQGDHSRNLKEILASLGFSRESVEVV